MDEWTRDADLALSDCAYLVNADPQEVIPLLGRARSPRARLAAAVYRLSLTSHRDADPQVRRQILSMDAARLGDGELARCFADVPVAGAAWPRWRPAWATGHRTDERLLLSIPAHEEFADAVACAELDGRPAAVTGGDDALVRVWDLITGRPIGDPIAGHDRGVETVQCAEIDGRKVIVSADIHGGVRAWDLVTHEPVTALSTGGFDSSRLLTAVELGRHLIVIAASRDTAQAWDVATAERIGRPMAGHTGGGIPELQAMACAELDGRVVLVTVGEQVLVWDLATSERIAELTPPGRLGDRVMTTVACTELDGRPVAIAACGGGEVLLWDLTTRKLIMGPLGGDTGGARDIACIDLDGHRIALIGDTSGTIRGWDLATGEILARPVGPPMSGFDDVRAFACTVVEDHPVVVTCGYEGWVRVWDVGHHEPAGRPVIGHTNNVWTLASARIGGRAAVLSGGTDHDEETGGWKQRARLWDLATGEPIGEPILWRPTHHPTEKDAAAYLLLDGREGSDEGIDTSVRPQNLSKGDLVVGPMPAVIWVDGRPVEVSVAYGGRCLRIWDLRTGDPFDMLISGGVRAVACTMLDERAVAVTGAWAEDDDSGERAETIHVWNLATGKPVGAPMTGYTGTVNALACATVDGRPVVVTAGDDGTVRRWDLSTRRQIAPPMTGHPDQPVRDLICTEIDGTPVAISSGRNSAQAWDLRIGKEFGPPLHFTCHIHDIATTPDGHLIIAFDYSDIAVLAPSPRSTAS